MIRAKASLAHTTSDRDVREFVAWKERQDEPFEFAEGEISLFPGGTLRHELIIANPIVALRRVATPRNVFGSGVQQLTSKSSRYPDVPVTFDPRDARERTFAPHPALIVEVSSPSTHGVERGAKFDDYRTIETPEEYINVDCASVGSSTIRPAGGDRVVSLPLVSGSVRVEGVGLTLSFGGALRRRRACLGFHILKGLGRPCRR